MELNSKEEKYYYELLIDLLEDGVIDDSERNILNKRKEKYSISDTRAKELEDNAKKEHLESKMPKFESDEEKEYYDLLLDTMADGMIDNSERNLLNKKKDKLGLSDSKALELERFAKNEYLDNKIPSLKTKEEKDYYELLIDMIEDGVIDESERNVLNKRREKYGISVSRASEIESLIIPSSKELQPVEVKEVEIVEKDKPTNALGRWNHLNKSKFLYFHIFTIAITLIFEIYFFIRLRGVLNNPKPMPQTAFEKFADMIKSAVSNFLPEAMKTGMEIANSVLFNVIIVALLVILLIALFFLYTFSARVLSIMASKTKKQVDVLYRIMAVLIPVSVSFIMVLFTEWDHMADRRAISKFKKENTDLIENEEYLKVFERTKNIRNNLALNYNVRFQKTETAEFDRLINNMINSFEKRNNLEMNDTNFAYIIGNLVPVYNNSIRNIPQYAETYNKVIGNSVSNAFNNRIDYLTSNTNYIGAYITISSIPNINIISEKEYLNNFRQAEYQTLLEKITNNFEIMINNEEMNIDNYNLIYKEFVFVFDKTLGINQSFWDKLKNTDVNESIENFGTKAGELVNSIAQGVKNFIGAAKGEERNLYEDKDIFVFDTKDIYFDEVGKNFMIQRMDELRRRLDKMRDKYLLDLDHRMEYTMKTLVNNETTLVEEIEKAIPTIVNYSEAKKDDVKTYYEYWNNMRHRRELELDQLKFELHYREKLNVLKSEFDDLLKKNMDYSNYMYIFNDLIDEILYYYTNLSSTQYRTDLWNSIKVNYNVLTKERHNFLKTFSKQLEEDIKNNNIERKEALEKAFQIVHYSNDKIDKDGLMGLLPSFLGGDTTYYKYWNNIRENLIKKIEKKFN